MFRCSNHKLTLPHNRRINLSLKQQLNNGLVTDVLIKNLKGMINSVTPLYGNGCEITEVYKIPKNPEKREVHLNTKGNVVSP